MTDFRNYSEYLLVINTVHCNVTYAFISVKGGVPPAKVTISSLPTALTTPFLRVYSLDHLCDAVLPCLCLYTTLFLKKI